MQRLSGFALVLSTLLFSKVVLAEAFLDTATNSDSQFKLVGAKVIFFVSVIAFVGGYLKKRYGATQNFSNITDSKIETLAHKVIKGATAISLVKIDNQKILIATTSSGGVAMLNLDVDSPVSEQKMILKEIVNG